MSKNFRKILSSLLIIVLILGCFSGIPVTANAAEIELSDSDTKKVTDIHLSGTDELAFIRGDDYTTPKVPITVEVKTSEPLDSSSGLLKFTLTGKDAKRFGIWTGSDSYSFSTPDLVQGWYLSEYPENTYSLTVYIGVMQYITGKDENGRLIIEGEWEEPLTGNEDVALTVSINNPDVDMSVSAPIRFVTGQEAMTDLMLNGRFTEQGPYYQGYGPAFFHGQTKDTVESGYFRQHLKANKTPHYSNEQVIWSIEGMAEDPVVAAEAASKYELYDARTGGEVVPFHTATDVADVYVSVKDNKTINARDYADEVKITVTSAINTGLADSCNVNVRADALETIWGNFLVYEDGNLRNLNADETAFIYVVDTNQKSEPQFREIKKQGTTKEDPALYELNLDNSLAVHLIHANIKDMFLLNNDETGIVPANTKVLTPYDHKDMIDERQNPQNPFNFKFVKMPQVSGRVVDQNGDPVKGAAVLGGAPCDTGSDGRFTTTLTIESIDEAREMGIGAYAEGYEFGAGKVKVDVDVEDLKEGIVLDAGEIVLTKTEAVGGNPFSDTEKNMLRLYSSEITSGQYATAMAYLYSSKSMSNAYITLSAEEAQLKDANGTIYVYELPSYRLVPISNFQKNGDKIHFNMDIKADTGYTLSFGVNGPALGNKPKINGMHEVAVTVNDGTKDYNVCNNMLTVNDLTMECPVEIGADEMLNVNGKAVLGGTANLNLEVYDVHTGNMVADKQQTQVKKDQTLYRFENITWANKKPGVYEVVVKLVNNGYEKDAEVRRTLIITPAPIEITSASFYDNIMPKITVPNPSSDLIFPQHVWMLDENRLDPQRTYKLDVGINAITKELPDGMGGEIQKVNFIINTRFGEHKYEATKTASNPEIYSAMINKLDGIGISEVFAEVIQKSYSNPSENITLKIKVMNLSQIVDPSGYVYDVAKGENHRIKDAEATLYYKDEDGNWAIWPAEDYQQINPQKTDDEGKYGWMVPEGDYEVRVTKEKYANYSTINDSKYGVITVLPARTDINIGLTSTNPTHTVTFDAGGGTGSMSKSTVSHGDNYKIPANGFTRTGYEFTGWKDAGGRSYAAGATIANITGSIALTAQWRIKTFTVTFNAGGGTGSMSKPTVSHGDNYKIPANGFTRTGYEFTGWKDTGGRSYTAGATIANITGSIALTAQWKIKTFTVTFNKNNAKAKGSTKAVTGNYNTNVKLNKSGFIRPGYVFSGWNTRADGKGVKYADSTTIRKINKNMVLYAQWKNAKLSKPTNFVLTSSKSRQLKVNYKKVTGAAGYRIQISTSSTFKAKTTSSYTTKKLSYTIKKLRKKNLSKGKKYYVRVQAYRKDSAGVTIYGAFAKGSKKTK